MFESLHLSVHLFVILSVCLIVSARYLLNHSTIFFNQTWYGIFDYEAMCHAEKLVLCLQCQIWLFLPYLLNCTTVCNQTWFQTWFDNTTLGFRLGLIVQHHKLGVVWKNWISVFPVKITAKVQNVSEWLLGWCFLNCRSFCYQTLYGDAAAWTKVSWGKLLFFWGAIFEVKVTAWGWYD